MRKYIWFLLLTIVCLSCENEYYTDEPTILTVTPEPEKEVTGGYKKVTVPGVLKIEFERSMLPQLENVYLTDEKIVQVDNDELNQVFSAMGVYSFERLFPENESYKQAEEKMGLDQWYKIKYNPSAQTQTKSRSIGLEDIKGVKYTEPQSVAVSTSTDEFIRSKRTSAERGSAMFFNDPELYLQWHYNNDGRLESSVNGADINLFKAWEIEVGKPNVIVAVVDHGVDVNHEDLRQNLWVNPLDGTHGYNSIDDNHFPEPGDHGTHVAGTIAAVNNNNIGVCGVAGGDGSPESGVRIMSIEFLRKPYLDDHVAGNIEAGFKFAAENGAVISQNSWGTYLRDDQGSFAGGYPDLDKSTQLAIDYFIEFAGCLPNGEQRPDSPMKGGVVLFASGNEFLDYSMPGAYSPVITVAATNVYMGKASYSNYGKWIDISAPGGEGSDGIAGEAGGVYSTLPANGYGYKNGTSMACPHVSGVAALIVSKFGKQGFTNEDLKRRLLTGVKDIDINEVNPLYAGLLGSGQIDAYKCLQDFSAEDQTAPVAPLIKEAKDGTQQFTVNFTNKAANAASWRVYYSTDKLTKENFSQKEYKELITYAKVNSELSIHAEKIKSGDYTIALVALSRAGEMSEPIFESVKVNPYKGLKVKALGDINATIREGSDHTFSFEIDTHADVPWSYEIFDGNKKGLFVNKTHEKMEITVISANLLPGAYSTIVRIGDEMMTEIEQIQFITVNYEVIKESASNKYVVEIRPLDMIRLSKEKKEIDLDDYFLDEDQKPNAHYRIGEVSSSVFTVELNENILTVTPEKEGTGTFKLEVAGKRGSIEKEIKVAVHKDELVYSIYPVPVSTKLNILFNDRVNDQVRISIKTILGVEVHAEILKEIPIDKHYSVDVKGLATGTYVLYVTSNKERYVKEFVKQ